MTQRPYLFAAAIAEVPVLDMLRWDPGRHTGQYGSASNPEEFPFIFAYSPVHAVRPGTCYPATLITTALNDGRVPAWHAMKFTAALQAAQSCPAPILLRADDVGGHAGSLGANDWIDRRADTWAFVARHTGLLPPAPGGR
jgi:prolyl oligopeptidase